MSPGNPWESAKMGTRKLSLLCSCHLVHLHWRCACLRPLVFPSTSSHGEGFTLASHRKICFSVPSCKSSTSHGKQDLLLYPRRICFSVPRFSGEAGFALVSHRRICFSVPPNNSHGEVGLALVSHRKKVSHPVVLMGKQDCFSVPPQDFL